MYANNHATFPGYDQSRKRKIKYNLRGGGALVTSKRVLHSTRSTMIIKQTYYTVILKQYGWDDAVNKKERYYDINEGEMNLLWY